MSISHGIQFIPREESVRSPQERIPPYFSSRFSLKSKWNDRQIVFVPGGAIVSGTDKERKTVATVQIPIEQIFLRIGKVLRCVKELPDEEEADLFASLHNRPIEVQTSFFRSRVEKILIGAHVMRHKCILPTGPHETIELVLINDTSLPYFVAILNREIGRPVHLNPVCIDGKRVADGTFGSILALFRKIERRLPSLSIVVSRENDCWELMINSPLSAALSEVPLVGYTKEGEVIYLTVGQSELTDEQYIQASFKREGSLYPEPLYKIVSRIPLKSSIREQLESIHQLIREDDIAFRVVPQNGSYYLLLDQKDISVAELFDARSLVTSLPPIQTEQAFRGTGDRWAEPWVRIGDMTDGVSKNEWEMLVLPSRPAS